MFRFISDVRERGGDDGSEQIDKPMSSSSSSVFYISFSDKEKDEPVVDDNESNDEIETRNKVIGVHHRVHGIRPRVGCVRERIQLDPSMS